jgi:hypothetical protein
VPVLKIQTTTPNEAPRETMFMTIALMGRTTEPNARNSSTAVTTAIQRYRQRRPEPVQ